MYTVHSVYLPDEGMGGGYYQYEVPVPANEKSLKSKDCPGCKPLEQEPVVEAPAETPAEELVIEPVEEKAADTIGEVIEESDARKIKYEKFNAVEQTFWAFYEVYFDPETDPADFDALLKEFLSILTGDTEKGRLTDKSIDYKAKGVDFLIEKAGRVLSRANREKMEAAIAALTDVLDADMPAEEEVPEEEAEKTLDITVGTINVTGFKKKKSFRNRQINKAVRHLLQYKK